MRLVERQRPVRITLWEQVDGWRGFYCGQNYEGWQVEVLVSMKMLIKLQPKGRPGLCEGTQDLLSLCYLCWHPWQEQQELAWVNREAPRAVGSFMWDRQKQGSTCVWDPSVSQCPWDPHTELLEGLCHIWTVVLHHSFQSHGFLVKLRIPITDFSSKVNIILSFLFSFLIFGTWIKIPLSSAHKLTACQNLFM